MKIRILIIFLSLSLSGCSLIYSYSEDLPQRIDQWILEKKYKTALNTISHINATHKDYRILQKKKTIILKQMTAYKKHSIEKANQLVRQGDWLVALALLDEVADNVIDKKYIKQHRNKLLAQRNKIISSYEYEILNNQAKDLIGKIGFYNKIKKIVSQNESNQLKISEFDDLRYETSLQLAERCEQQYQTAQYNKAFNTIKVALKLTQNKDIILRLKKTKVLVQKATQAKRLSYINEAKALLSKLSQGYSYAILKETKDKVAWLNKIKRNEKVYLDLIAKLKKHLTAGEKQHFEAARKLYSEGKTQEALIIWLELKKLNPDHPKLLSHIKRAEKILIKLERLTNKPKPENKK